MYRIFVLLIVIVLLSTACGNRKSQQIQESTLSGYKMEIAEEGNVIDVHGNVKHLQRMDEFVQLARKSEEGSIRIVRYTIEGDPIFYDLTLSDGHIQFRYDNTEDKFGSGRVSEYSCGELERTGSATRLGYVLKGCSGDNKEWEVLNVSFDVQKQDRFEFILKYGVNRSNEINTVEGKLVKELHDGETATLESFQLSAEERQDIYRKMVMMNYLGDKKLSAACDREPHETYYLKVLINGGSREYEWSECDRSEDGLSMTGIMTVIRSIIEKREDYRGLA